MFKFVGKKIKLIAKISFVLNIIATIVLDFIICNFLNRAYDTYFTVLFLVFLAFAGIGFLISWITPVFIYGFGILVSEAECNQEDYEGYDEDIE